MVPLPWDRDSTLCGVWVGDQEFSIVCDTGAARTLASSEVTTTLRSDLAPTSCCFERLAAQDPKVCRVAAENSPTLQVDSAQQLRMVFDGFAVSRRGGRATITDDRVIAVLNVVPCGETPNLSEHLILGLAEAVRSGMTPLHVEKHGERKVFV